MIKPSSFPHDIKLVVSYFESFEIYAHFKFNVCYFRNDFLYDFPNWWQQLLSGASNYY